jgi:GNAT superfamily N-acetyltransferase
MAETIETLVTYLEMRENHHRHVPPPANLRLLLMRAESPPVHFYRYLYDTVGDGLMWIDRKKMSDAELASNISSELVEVYVLYVAGVPAGYFEVDARGKPTEVELKYFGLIREFHGRGLGKYLLSEAITACWAHAPERVIVDTCTFDGPLALPLYQKMGFTPYDRRPKLYTLPEGTTVGMFLDPTYSARTSET